MSGAESLEDPAVSLEDGAVSSNSLSVSVELRNEEDPSSAKIASPDIIHAVLPSVVPVAAATHTSHLLESVSGSIPTGNGPTTKVNPAIQGHAPNLMMANSSDPLSVFTSFLSGSLASLDRNANALQHNLEKSLAISEQTRLVVEGHATRLHRMELELSSQRRSLEGTLHTMNGMTKDLGVQLTDATRMLQKEIVTERTITRLDISNLRGKLTDTVGATMSALHDIPRGYQATTIAYNPSASNEETVKALITRINEIDTVLTRQGGANEHFESSLLNNSDTLKKVYDSLFEEVSTLNRELADTRTENYQLNYRVNTLEEQLARQEQKMNNLIKAVLSKNPARVLKIELQRESRTPHSNSNADLQSDAAPVAGNGESVAIDDQEVLGSNTNNEENDNGTGSEKSATVAVKGARISSAGRSKDSAREFSPRIQVGDSGTAKSSPRVDATGTPHAKKRRLRLSDLVKNKGTSSATNSARGNSSRGVSSQQPSARVGSGRLSTRASGPSPRDINEPGVNSRVSSRGGSASRQNLSEVDDEEVFEGDSPLVDEDGVFNIDDSEDDEQLVDNHRLHVLEEQIGAVIDNMRDDYEERISELEGSLLHFQRIAVVMDDVKANFDTLKQRVDALTQVNQTPVDKKYTQLTNQVNNMRELWRAVHRELAYALDNVNDDVDGDGLLRIVRKDGNVSVPDMWKEDRPFDHLSPKLFFYRTIDFTRILDSRLRDGIKPMSTYEMTMEMVCPILQEIFDKGEILLQMDHVARNNNSDYCFDDLSVPDLNRNLRKVLMDAIQGSTELLEEGVSKLRLQQSLNNLMEEVNKKANKTVLAETDLHLRQSLSNKVDHQEFISITSRLASNTELQRLHSQMAEALTNFNNGFSAYGSMGDNKLMSDLRQSPEFMDMLEKVEILIRKFSDMDSKCAKFIPKEEVHTAMRAVVDEMKAMRKNYIPLSVFREGLQSKVDITEMQNLVLRLTEKLGELNFDFTNTAAAFHAKCLMCDKPVANHSKSRCGPRPSTSAASAAHDMHLLLSKSTSALSPDPISDSAPITPTTTRPMKAVRVSAEAAVHEIDPSDSDADPQTTLPSIENKASRTRNAVNASRR